MAYYKNMYNTQTSSFTQRNIKKELLLLRSFMIGVAGKDSEGNYRPEFIRKILNFVNEQPTYTFQNASAFLGSIEKYSQ